MSLFYQLLFHLLSLCSWYQVCSAVYPFSSATLALEKTTTIIRAVEDYWRSPEHKSLQLINVSLYNELIALSTDIDDNLLEILQGISEEIKRGTMVIQVFLKSVETVQSSYKKFIELLNNSDKYERTTLHLFANESTSPDNEKLQGTLETVHELFHYNSYRGQSFLSIIAENHATTVNNVCKKSKSEQQLINELYELLVNSTIKGMLITSFSYDVKSKYENIPYKFELQQAKQMFNDRINRTCKSAKRVVSVSPREIWRCDSWEQVKDVTYGKLEQIFQAFFVDDEDVADTSHESSDKFADDNQCKDIKDARLHCRTRTCRTQTKKCTGHLRDCKDMPTYFQVCYSDTYSERRYNWVRQDVNQDNAMYGEYNDNCHNRTTIFRVFRQSETKHLPTMPNYNADLCVCNCESEYREAVRYFSLQDVMADQNKVVTGVKLAIASSVFHIQIQQGTLGAYATITDEPQWKDINLIRAEELLGPKVSRQQPTWVEFYENNLVYTVTYQQSYVYLDTLYTDPSRLVTGFRFRQVGHHLKLEIQTTPFDYVTGKLDKTTSSWKFSENNRLDRRDEVILKKPGNPTDIHGPDVVSSGNKYVQFRMTDLEKDVGSYTVPFVDLQEVITNPPTPLVGAGLIHRGKTNSGGFLGLQIIHYDYMIAHLYS